VPNRDTAATCSFDKDLRYLGGNEAFFAILGLPREEVVGRGYLDLFPQLEGTEGHRMLQRALTTLQPQRIRIHSAFLDKDVDCEVFPVAGGLQATFRVVDDPSD
jgi:PAS domain S-box-containing protein